MVLNGNLFFDRYEWASLKIREIQGSQSNPMLSLFDIGSRDNILRKYLDDQSVSIYKGFDLDPLTDAERWDIEKPFPYGYPKTQIVTLLEVIEHLENLLHFQPTTA